MIFREAFPGDISQIQRVRNSVNENVLSDPAIVTNADCERYLVERGKGWVCEAGNWIVGFSIVDLLDRNVWALFVDPHFEKMGIGRRLHEDMLAWYFSRADATLWLSTAPGTRAEGFYRAAGWKYVGLYRKTELKFELTADEWRRRYLSN